MIANIFSNGQTDMRTYAQLASITVKNISLEIYWISSDVRPAAHIGANPHKKSDFEAYTKK